MNTLNHRPRAAHRLTAAHVRGVRTAWAVVLLLGIAAEALACGPYYDHRVIRYASDARLLSAPLADFEFELKHAGLLAAKMPRIHNDGGHEAFDSSVRAGAADLAAALAATDMPEAQRRRLLERYRKLRTAMRAVALQRMANSERDAEWSGRLREADADAIAGPQVPAGLPREFALYLAGALDYHRGDYDKARKYWQAVVDLPEDQRPYRGLWAAYMIGRSYVGDDDAKALQWFDRAEKLLERSKTRLELAGAIHGWRGRAHLNRNEPGKAIAAYLEQVRIDRSGAALTSLRIAARASLASGDDPFAQHVELARNNITRQVITAHLLAVSEIGAADDHRKVDYANWADALAQAEVADAKGADRLAWMAYKANRLELARKWLALAPAEAPVALWLRAKLAMRDGDLDAAAPLLARAVKAFPKQQAWIVGWDRAMSPPVEAAGELGAIHLTRGDYVQAMELLYRTRRYMTDGYYIASRVLTIDELRPYVDSLEKDTLKPIAVNDAAKLSDDDLRPHLRNLLAQRLARTGQMAEAIKYYSEGPRKIAEAYRKHLNAGRDKTRPAEQRADALWNAAQLVAEQGRALFGGGDAAKGSDGAWQWRDPLRSRWAGAPANNKVFRWTADEKRRADRHFREAGERFHYGYIAGDLAWEACGLMADQSNTTAWRLCVAGTWLKVRDPKYADKFYKALATRCSETELGKRARAKHWFPDIKQDTIFK